MPNKHLTEAPLLTLAKAVGRSAGMDITCTRDCEVLSEELRLHDGRFPVSVSTLKRFFGLVERQGSFSLTTLNSLARYVGYSSYQHFKDSHSLIGTSQSTSSTPSLPPKPGKSNTTPKDWTAEQANHQIQSFIGRFANPDDFRLTSAEFNRLKEAVFFIYRRGDFDMSLWLDIVEHKHLLRFVVEQFPPLDFLNSFGKDMVLTYRQVATSPNEKMFGNGLLAAAAFATGQNWQTVLPLLSPPDRLNPSIHPLVQARNIGLWLLAGLDVDGLADQKEAARNLAIQGLERGDEIWPRWANQNCYFAFNIADWAILSGDHDLVRHVKDNITSFRQKQDWYNQDLALDTILTLRQIWNHLFLNEEKQAAVLSNQLDWGQFHSMETRTLGMWYHAAMWKLGEAPPDICDANIRHCASMTGYAEIERRIRQLLFDGGQKK